jgi:hypothetical protein
VEKEGNIEVLRSALPFELEQFRNKFPDRMALRLFADKVKAWRKKET